MKVTVFSNTFSGKSSYIGLKILSLLLGIWLRGRNLGLSWGSGFPGDLELLCSSFFYQSIVGPCSHFTV